MAKLLVLHGPNLNLLGTREPEVYGRTTLARDRRRPRARAPAPPATQLEACSPTPSPRWSTACRPRAPTAPPSSWSTRPRFTHTSVALRDALAAVALPFIEVHLSNPHAREPFRRTSYFSDLAVGVVAGFGADSYRYALDAALAAARA